MATKSSSSSYTNKFSAFSVKSSQPICSISCPNFFRPNLGDPKTTFKSCRLKISQKQSWATNCVMPVSVVSCFDDNSDGLEHSGSSNASSQEVTIDLKLPRRSLLVKFTCNVCNERSERLINRLAYEKGTVYVKCSGCLQYHNLVDNLNLVVEHDFREDVNADREADQI